jgi:hypothetical protein
VENGNSFIVDDLGDRNASRRERGGLMSRWVTCPNAGRTCGEIGAVTWAPKAAD